MIRGVSRGRKINLVAIFGELMASNEDFGGNTIPPESLGTIGNNFSCLFLFFSVTY